jgi:hypothetical protein
MSCGHIVTTSIHAILRPVCLFGTMYLFGSSWSSGVGFDRDKVVLVETISLDGLSHSTVEYVIVKYKV